MSCPFCNAEGQASEVSPGWHRCPNEHMWLPPDGRRVKPEARTIWICHLCRTFRGKYGETLHHLVNEHEDAWARRELRGIQNIVDAVRGMMYYDADKARRQRRLEPITDEEVGAFRDFLYQTDDFDFSRPDWASD